MVACRFTFGNGRAPIVGELDQPIFHLVTQRRNVSVLAVSGSMRGSVRLPGPGVYGITATDPDNPPPVEPSPPPDPEPPDEPDDGEALRVTAQGRWRR